VVSDGLGIVHMDWAILLMGVVPVTWLLWYLLTRRRRRGERIRFSPKRSATFEVSVVALILVAWAIAALRPFSGFEDVEVSVGGRDIMAIVDVSNSMLATDVSPSRLGLVRRKLHDLLRLVSESGRRDRVGVVVFAGSAQVFCPLTSDFTALRNFINAISHELLVQGGTNLPAAMEVALASLPASSSGWRG
jgi:Ca-activated chloride channel family protein